ncbi:MULTISPECIES: cytochrome c oxidase subunit 4 [Leifsonia]|uniref:aa3-type cytochrome oxidase subunit IV n=1 Tax=Leifsonia TaxID=110932 RepID=UPI0028A96D8C|nr:cytochrome c oxidase subunit 4 [Leifsonia aquatica]
MKIAAGGFWVLAAYFFVAGNLYAGWGLIEKGYIDWSGGTPLGLCAVLCALVAFFLNRSHRTQSSELPEDVPTANIDDGDPELGHFSPWSWWPFALAAACFLTFLGFAIGLWLILIGAGLAAVSLVGWVYEYYRGYFAR